MVWDQIPLDYESADRDTVKVALKLLEDGRALRIFPVRRIGRGDFGRIRHGVALLHSRDQCTDRAADCDLWDEAMGMTKNQLPRRVPS